MDHKGWDLFRLGLERRRTETRKLRKMMGLATFLLAFTLLFQDNINGFVMEKNYLDYGSWLFRTEDDRFSQNPYLYSSSLKSGAPIERLTAASEEIIDEDEASESAGPEEVEDRLTVPFEDDSRKTNIRLGTFSETFAKQQYIGLYEGRLPEKPGEIAMELIALQELGSSYELGQEISFYMKETQKPGQEKEKVLVRKRFILVGTLERYTARWNNGHELPGALVSEDEFRQLDTEKQTYYFWELKETYKKGDVWHFASELMDDVLARDEGITANTAAFYNPFWGDPVLYRNMILILLILSVSLMAYLMAVYYSGRRKFFLQLREIGASTAEVWRMAAFECVLSVLPAIVLALATAYLFSLAAVFAAMKLSKTVWFYVFSVKTLGLIFAGIVLTLGLSLIISLLIFTGGQISEKRKSPGKIPAKRLKNRSLKRHKLVLSYYESLKRDRFPHELSGGGAAAGLPGKGAQYISGRSPGG